MAFIDSLLTAFVLVFVSELGDKTQLALVAFSAENPKRSKEIWLGASTAMVLLILFGVIVGRGMAGVLDARTITLISSLLFLAFGLHTLFLGKDKEAVVKKNPNTKAGKAKTKASEKSNLFVAQRAAFWETFAFIAVSEMGDKSQIAVLTLAAVGLGTGGAAGVFAGAAIAQVILAGVGVFFGKNVAQSLPRKLIRTFSGLLFLIAAALPWVMGAA